MALVLDTCLALKVACVARQAERSVAFGLRSEAQWSGMREYYHQERLRPVLDTIESLDGLTTCPNQQIARESVFRWGLLGALEYGKSRLLNCLRKHFRFSDREIWFLANVLHRFVEDLQKAEKPEPQHLVELRMDLLTCHELIGRRLAGVAAFDRAMDVEHFCQAEHIRSFTIEEVCGSSPLVSA
jgi:hypothetical protein